MLVSKVKKKEMKEGAPEFLYLVPELCTRTGLTDKMRSNFTVMKDLAVHTRVNPNTRAQTLGAFRNKIQNSATATDVLKKWGVRFSDGLVPITGRVCKAETVLQGPPRNSKDPKVVSDLPASVVVNLLSK